VILVDLGPVESGLVKRELVHPAVTPLLIQERELKAFTTRFDVHRGPARAGQRANSEWHETLGHRQGGTIQDPRSPHRCNLLQEDRLPGELQWNWSISYHRSWKGAEAQPTIALFVIVLICNTPLLQCDSNPNTRQGAQAHPTQSSGNEEVATSALFLKVLSMTLNIAGKDTTDQVRHAAAAASKELINH
jgi:hypothetical protein